MTTPDEEITLRQADVEALHARIAEMQHEITKLKKRNNALAWLWMEAKEQAYEWRNEAVNGDKHQCARTEEPLPWEPQSLCPDPDQIKEERRIALSQRGCQEYHWMCEIGEL